MSQLWRELALCDWPQEPEQLSLRREEVTGSGTTRTSMDFATRLYRTGGRRARFREDDIGVKAGFLAKEK